MYVLLTLVALVLALPFTLFHTLNIIGEASADSLVTWLNDGVHKSR